MRVTAKATCEHSPVSSTEISSYSYLLLFNAIVIRAALAKEASDKTQTHGWNKSSVNAAYALVGDACPLGLLQATWWL